MRARAGLTVIPFALASASFAVAQECDPNRTEVFHSMYLGRNVTESPIAGAYADRHAGAQTVPLSVGSCEAVAARYQYMGDFFRGFRDADGFLSGVATAPSAAFLEGKKFRIDNPDKTQAVYASFGYKAVDAVALWNPASQWFRPIGDHAGEQWQREGQAASSNYRDRGKARELADLRVRVTGYVSPSFTVGGVTHRALLIRELSESR